MPCRPVSNAALKIQPKVGPMLPIAAGRPKPGVAGVQPAKPDSYLTRASHGMAEGGGYAAPLGRPPGPQPLFRCACHFP